MTDRTESGVTQRLAAVEASAGPEATPPPAATRSQFVRFAFYKLRPAWFDLGPAARRTAASEFIGLLESRAGDMLIRTYSLIGLRADVDFLIWLATEELQEVHDLAVALRAVEMGRYLEQPYSYLSVTRRSMYVKNQRETRPTGHRLQLQPQDRQYLFVYPFVKTRAWYALPREERQEMMNEHIRVGNRFPSVRLNTTYSFGLDDQEFVVAFETDEPRDFVDLVMELRETRGSAYTLRDTPIFSCMRASPTEIFAALGA